MGMNAVHDVGIENETMSERLRRVLAVHFDPREGSAFWLARAATLGIDARRDIRDVADLAALGEMSPADLRGRPLLDLIPKRFHGRLDQFIVGQTGGATGEGVWTAYRVDEFEEAFIVPFVDAARYVGFPCGGAWLYIGPSGPHVIGKVVRHLANALGSMDPFSVDFDPRWARTLPAGSLARKRYVQHVVAQATTVMASQDIGVLFTTPAVLEPLAEAMTAEQRARIRGVHYGGMAVSADAMLHFQRELFPNAVHLSGYGNTLFGCCLELRTDAGRELDYFPHGARLLLEVVDAQGQPVPPGQPGRVRFTRLDESMLLVRCLERDEAQTATAPDDAPEAFVHAGVRNPDVPAVTRPQVNLGLY